MDMTALFLIAISLNIRDILFRNGKLDSQNNSIAAGASSPVKSSGGRLEEYYGKLEMPHEVIYIIYHFLRIFRNTKNRNSVDII